jgi:hypothetical protein
MAREQPPEELRTGLGAMVEAASGATVVPSGLIFHISRCGADVLARWLSATSSALVLSDVTPLNAVLSPYVRVRYSLEIWRDIQRAALPALVTLYGKHMRRTSPRVVVKFATLSILEAHAIRAVWPKVPCILMVRDPVDVIESHLLAPAPWVQAVRDRLNALALFGIGPEVHSLTDMTNEELVASIIGRVYDASVSLCGGNCWIVKYGTAASNNEMQRLARWFNLAVDRLDEGAEILRCQEAANDVMGKPATARELDAKRSAAVRRAAEKWALPAYARLLRYAE